MREGLIPTLLGSAVMASGAMLRGVDMEKRGMHKKDLMPLLSAGLVGFGLAHVVLGTKDLVKR
ncbi:MAG: hypothetical protein K0R80_3228 [Clostridia bacterium]|jgi:hypothetical protein|nr:hypothetical protein [Clostridia bacterium]MDF2892861.1 hypothetical protein [Clostridia bacterium]